MSFVVSDVYIGNAFPITQHFGDNPIAYARFNIRGHDGIDFGCPANTQIVSAADGWIKEVAFDANGYGNYVKVVHDGFLTVYGHLTTATVKVGDKVVAGQLIGLSGNTGNSTGPHLHFGVAACTVQGDKTEIGNGYSGYTDPLAIRVSWQIKQLKSPVVPVPQTPPTSTSQPQPGSDLYDQQQAIRILRSFVANHGGNLEGAANTLIQDAYPALVRERDSSSQTPILTNSSVQSITPSQSTKAVPVSLLQDVLNKVSSMLLGNANG